MSAADMAEENRLLFACLDLTKRLIAKSVRSETNSRQTEQKVDENQDQSQTWVLSPSALTDK